MLLFLLRPWDFFNYQAGYCIPACLAICVSPSSTVSNIDTNADFTLGNVIAVAFYCTWNVVVLAATSKPIHCFNWQRTAALGAVKGDEPSLTALVAVQTDVALKNNTESSVIFFLDENAIL